MSEKGSESSGRQLSRRGFLKITALSVGAAAATQLPEKVLNKLTKENGEKPFDVVIADSFGSNEGEVIFDNNIDFQETPEYIPRQPKVSYASFLQEQPEKVCQKEGGFLGVQLIEPCYPIIIDDESEKGVVSKGITDAATIPGKVILASVLAGGYNKTRKKGLAIASGLLFGTSIFEALTTAFSKPKTEHETNELEKTADSNESFPIHSKLSSMRAMIIMADAWKNLGKEYHTDPVQAVSRSNVDGLEAYIKYAKDIASLERALVLDTLFHPTLIRSAVGTPGRSVFDLFTYKITNLYTREERIYTVSNTGHFLSDLHLRIGGSIPSKPLTDSLAA
jgi:hypothetical protein